MYPGATIGYDLCTSSPTWIAIEIRRAFPVVGNLDSAYTLHISVMEIVSNYKSSPIWTIDVGIVLWNLEIKKD